MASKGELLKAIIDLEVINKSLKNKLSEEKDKAQKNKINQMIAKNNAMILDYTYRIKYNEMI